MIAPPAGTETPHREASGLAVASIIVSAALTAVGNGMMFAYIPFSLGAAGYAPAWAGSILTALSAGGLVGCLTTGAIVRRGDHARAFMIFSALIVLSNALVATGVQPVLWLAARALYGFAICGMFIVAQSWLNDAVDNSVRGRVMAIFYVAYIVGLGCGSLLMGQIDISGAAAPIVAIAFAAFAILPVGMTSLPQPAPPARASLALGRAWRISPVGVAGMLAVGGLSMMIAGFAPIHATASGFTQSQVATLMFAMPLGTLFVQIPLGWISDRTDRRYVLIAAALLVVGFGVLAGVLDGSALVVLVAIYMVWDGASESIYSLATAHAGDRARRDEMVQLQSTMLFAWSLSGFVVPGVGTLLTGFYGTVAFIWVAVAIAAVYAAFVGWRLTRAEAPAAEDTVNFAPLSATSPLPVELTASEQAEASAR
jgi:predicted MFS family arabinose efflux permease